MKNSTKIDGQEVELPQELVDLVKKSIESKKDIKERVKSFENAFDIVTKISSKTEKDYYMLMQQGNLPKYIINYYRLCIITQALNEGWKPDWNNFYEYKYFPYFSIEKYGGDCKGASAGLDYCYTLSGATLASTYIGSRLCFRTRELSEYAGKQFKDFYEIYYLN